MAGVATPLLTFPQQAFVTEPLEPFLHPILASEALRVSIAQTDRGEVLVGTGIGRYASSSQASILDVLEVTAARLRSASSRVRSRPTAGGTCEPPGSSVVEVVARSARQAAVGGHFRSPNPRCRRDGIGVALCGV